MADSVQGLATQGAEISSGPSPPSHGNRSRMRRTRSVVGPVWSGRGEEARSPRQPRRAWKRVMMGMMMEVMMGMIARLQEVTGGPC